MDKKKSGGHRRDVHLIPYLKNLADYSTVQ